MKRSKGFTLVEVVCALAVLSLVVLAFTVLITAGSKMNINAWNLKRATQAGVENLADENPAQLDITNENLIIQITGKSQVSISVKKYLTKSISDKQAVHLEKLK